MYFTNFLLIFLYLIYHSLQIKFICIRIHNKTSTVYLKFNITVKVKIVIIINSVSKCSSDEYIDLILLFYIVGVWMHMLFSCNDYIIFKYQLKQIQESYF